MATFPLPEVLATLHDDVIWYATVLQNTIAEHGGCQSMASESLNALGFNGILAHRAVRTLCEEGWTPVTPILNRTLLDIFANSVAVVNRPDQADYMGFKYMSDFYRKWLTDPEITQPERDGASGELESFTARLSEADQVRARALIQEGRPRTYWFQPEYETTRELLELSPHNIHALYKLLSSVTHGGFSAKLVFNDDPASEDINPRQHQRWRVRAIVASCRLLLEICYVRDQWDNLGVGEGAYNELVLRINALREP